MFRAARPASARFAVSSAAAASLFFAFGCGPKADPPGFTVFAAANLRPVLPALVEAFAAASGGAKPTTIYGSTGALVSQIENGASFDLFLSADMEAPERLTFSGRADAATLKAFATGRLSIVARNDANLDLRRGLSVALDATRKVAVANPKVAPFGRAAEQAFGRAGVLDAVSGRFVHGESVAQAFSFVVSGAADMGVVASSAAYGLDADVSKIVSFAEIDPTLYDAPVLGAVVSRTGGAVDAARAFLDFLAGPAARATLDAAGYGPPPRTGGR